MKTDAFFHLLSIPSAFDPAEASLVTCMNLRSPKHCQILGPGRPYYRLRTILKFMWDWSQVKWTGEEEEADLRPIREETEGVSKPQKF